MHSPYSSYSLAPEDAEPVVRAHLLDVLALSGSEVAEIEGGDRLDRLGLGDLPTAWLITELHVATGVDPLTRDRGLAGVSTVGDLIGVYREALEEAGARVPVPPGAAAPAAPAPDPPDPPDPPDAPGQPDAPEPPEPRGRRLIGPLREVGAERFAAPLLASAEGTDSVGGRLRDEVVLEAARQLWTTVVRRRLPGAGRRMRIWTERLDATFSEPVFAGRATLECGDRLREREPLCERVAVTTEARQAGVRAAVFEVELRVLPAAVARAYELLKARRAAASAADPVERRLPAGRED